MKSAMRKTKSFCAAYFTIPVVFYAVDMVCQETFYDGRLVGLVPLTIILTWVSYRLFRGLLQQKYIRVESPISAAVGASVGLLHFFTLYILIGTYLVWKSSPAEGLVWTMEDTKYMLLRVVFPFVDTYLFYCDGALLPGILSIAFFMKLGIEQHKRLSHA